MLFKIPVSGLGVTLAKERQSIQKALGAAPRADEKAKTKVNQPVPVGAQKKMAEATVRISSEVAKKTQPKDEKLAEAFKKADSVHKDNVIKAVHNINSNLQSFAEEVGALVIPKKQSILNLISFLLHLRDQFVQMQTTNNLALDKGFVRFFRNDFKFILVPNLKGLKFLSEALRKPNEDENFPKEYNEILITLNGRIQAGAAFFFQIMDDDDGVLCRNKMAAIEIDFSNEDFKTVCTVINEFVQGQKQPDVKAASGGTPTSKSTPSKTVMSPTSDSSKTPTSKSSCSSEETPGATTIDSKQIITVTSFGSVNNLERSHVENLQCPPPHYAHSALEDEATRRAYLIVKEKEQELEELRSAVNKIEDSNARETALKVLDKKSLNLLKLFSSTKTKELENLKLAKQIELNKANALLDNLNKLFI